MQKLRRSGLSIAYHKAGTAFAVAAGLVLVSVSAVPAYAFKIFGMSFFESEPEPEVVDPVRYDVTLNTPGADDDLAETLQNSSQLYQDREKPVSGNLGLAIKARDDRDRILAALYENARYGGLVDIRIAGRALDDLPPDPHFATGQPVPVTVTIMPGPVFTLRSIRFTGDASGRNTADYKLNPGDEAKSTVILRAGEKMVADLKSEGRPFARLTARNAVADHATSTVDVEIGAEGGPVATLGFVAVTGTKTIDPEFVEEYSRLNGGQPYSPERLQKASDRLRQLSVFSSVTIREANQLQPDGSLPLTIEVSEGKHRYFGAGAQVSTTEGVGLQGYWGHRNLFGRAESLRIEGSVDRIGESKDATKLDYSAGIAFAKPGAFGPASTFTASAKAALLDPDAYKATTFTGAVGVSFELSEQDTISGGAELAYADVEDPFGKNKYLTASIPLDYVRDTRDNKLNPTTGYRATLSAKPSYETRNGTLFSTFEASGTAYKGFGSENRFVLAGKLAAGSIVGGGDLSSIPATRRYYLGGGGTVRGYAYQEISPRNAQNELLGGRSFVQGSVEMRVGITEKISVVPFIDAATVSADSTPDFNDIRAGAGIGLRYATPFGPIRLDVAMPLKKYDGGTSYGIYAGIGQAF